MGRKKLIEDKISDVPDTMEFLPSNEFCKNCKSSDIRLVKDTLIVILNTLYAVAEELDTLGDDWKSTVNNTRKWVINSRNNNKKVKIRSKGGKIISATI